MSSVPLGGREVHEVLVGFGFLCGEGNDGRISRAVAGRFRTGMIEHVFQMGVSFFARGRVFFRFLIFVFHAYLPFILTNGGRLSADGVLSRSFSRSQKNIRGEISEIKKK